MNLELEGKLALVSGSTAGIGRAIAESLAAEGAEVVVNGRSQERVNTALEEIRSAHPKAKVRGLAADLGTAVGVATLLEELPRVDILVNNLGIFEPKEFEQIPDEDWLRMFEVNVMSGVRLSRALLGGMKEKDWGRVIFISSESAVQIPTEMIHYGMSKTAQLAISRGLAESLAGTGVTVNSVLVGPTRSEGVGVFIEQMAEQAGATDLAAFEGDFLKQVRPTSLIGRFLKPEEVASVVTFLCSPLASAITGASVRAEGGLLKGIL
jgi:NAD(P)-dependent dehydrogenase (short-subunit alcohol dehydrogenase family)